MAWLKSLQLNLALLFLIAKNIGTPRVGREHRAIFYASSLYFIKRIEPYVFAPNHGRRVLIKRAVIE